MRKLIALVTLSLILLAFSSPVQSLPAETYDIGVRRELVVGDWGLVVLNDTLRISNTGISPISSIDFALPRSDVRNLRFMSAWDQSGTILELERDFDASSTYYWVKVNFRDKLPPGDKTDVKISSAYANLVTFLAPIPEKNFEEKFTLSIPVTPILKTSARYSNVTISLQPDAGPQIPSNSSFVSTRILGNPGLAAEMGSLPAMTSKYLTFNFTSSTQRIIQCNWAKREIEITPWGDLRVSDSFKLTNRARSFPSVRISLPRYAKDVMPYDELGALSTAASSANPIEVAPRFRNVKQDDSVTFILKYLIPAGRGVEQLKEFGLYNLAVDLIPSIKCVVEKAEITLRTPQGLRVEQIQPKPTKVETGIYETKMNYQINDATFLAESKLTMKYRYLPFWAAFAPMIWLIIIVAGAVATRLILKKRTPSEILSAVPVDAIRRFVELHDERNALRMELGKIAQEAARGALTRQEQRRRTQQMEAMNEKIRRELRPSRATLFNTSARYAEMVRRIERAEAEIDSALASEEQLRSQYRSGRMSRSVYDEMSSQVRKRSDRARETINSTIVTLREEAR